MAQDSGGLYGAELHIMIDDDLVQREVFRDERTLHLRSQQIFEQLAAQGPVEMSKPE